MADPLTATDAQVADYADNYFEYDSSKRVTKEVAQGAGCSACAGGFGTFTYSYTDSGYQPQGTAIDFNSWQTVTVETLPDGNRNVVYTNPFGQVMLKVFVDDATDQEWEEFYAYDADGRTLLMAGPEAVT
ncbi:MAG TPA: hypothetical protein VIL46_04160, partial [Gemmataceae bacterium]